MIIWSGKGLILALFMLVAGLIINGVFTVFNLPFIEKYVITLGLLITALINFYFIKWLDKRPKKVLIDKETNEEVILEDNSSLFFIPLRYWTYILGIGAVIFYIIE